MIDGVKAAIFDIGSTLYSTTRNMGDVHRGFLIEMGLNKFAEIPDPQLEGAQSRGPDAWLDSCMLQSNVDMYWEPTRQEWVEYDRRLLEAIGVQGPLEDLAEEYQKKWDRYLSDSRYVLLDECKETLEELQRRGYKLAIASNRFGDPRPFLKRDSILSLLDSVEYTAVPGYKKPSPFMLLKVADDLRINPRRCVYVGNYVRYDVEAAIRAEMKPILITWCNPEEKDSAPPDMLIIDHIREMLNLLE
ncbi:MAG: HAD family hydrolase [Candidatus Thorarchaeota archaeon]